MATRLLNSLNQTLPTLRYEPTGKWIRAALGSTPVLDSRRAVLLWEPMRVTPIYAVPESDVLAVLRESALIARAPENHRMLFPEDAFIVHSTPGTVLDVVLGDSVLEGAAYRFDDMDLEGLVEFDFLAFNWLEEDEPLMAHARDPFHRIDIRSSSRHVIVELNGVLLAESANPTLLFETRLPERYYLPPEDVNWQELEATDSTSMCPYKGTANYWTVPGAGHDIAWSYASPVPGSEPLAGLVCFYNERVDLRIDGEARIRPESPFG